MTKLRGISCLLLALLYAPAEAQAWEPFRAENKDVKRGNELLEHGRAEQATQAYEAAQRSLPNDPGVQLNKGLGLLGVGKLPEAREAFRAASQGGNPELRGKANYNLGLTFLREADTLAKEEKLEESQKLLTESIDAFKNSLRNAPKNRDAAWNLEIAKRRLVDLEQKKQEQQQKQDQEKQDQEKQDQDPKQDQEKQDQDPKQDQEKQDQDPKQDQDQAQSKQDQPKDQGEQQKPEQKDKPGQDQAKAPQPEKGSQGEPQEPQPTPNQKALPEHMQRALDALSESDDNLQKQRARARARQRPQRIEKDW
jgi:Ca-activated chloride channel family protein